MRSRDKNMDGNEEVMEKYDAMMDWLAKLNVVALSMFHYMHDK